MPDPDIVRETTSECDLKLNGDKIKLVTRPLSKESTASSRCALLGRGISRPSSAVPALNLYRKDDFDTHVNTKRPFSADDSPYKSKHKLKDIDLLSDLQDVEDKDLPSSELLKNLISEPISDWKRKQEKPDSGSSYSDESLETKIQSVAGSDHFLCELTPGLKSKPPLPKKLPTNSLKIEDEIEEIRVKSQKFDDEFAKKYATSNEKADKFFQQEMTSEKEFNSYMQGEQSNFLELEAHENDVEEYNMFFEELKSATSTFMGAKPPRPSSDRRFDEVLEDQSNLPTSKSENQLGFKNWVNADTFTNNDVSKSEKRTDSYFQSLKNHHEEIDKCIDRAQKVLDKTKKHSDDSKGKSDDDLELLQNYKFEKFFEREALDNTKIDSGDLTKAPVSSRSNEKTSKTNKRPPTKKNNAKITAMEGTSKPGKGKFTAKPMRSYRDYSEKSSKEEESWMSKEKSSTEPNEADTQSEEKPKPKSYLDFLNNVDDLEQVTKVLNEIPEHDTEVDANTYDDIVQILEVLEAEDKKSQKTMESIKELVSKELNAAVSQLQHERPAPNDLSHSKSTESLRSSSAASKNSDQERVSAVSLTSTTSSNYNEILSFLDEVDRNCTKSLVCAKERVHKVTQFLEKAICLDSVPKKEDLQVLNNDELSDQIVNLNLRLKEKSSSIKLLQDELSSLREQLVKNSKHTEDIVRQKIKQQKEEHEAVVKRHQKFIDQLIADKKVLNQQCEGLINEMKLLEDRYKSNTKAAEHRHHVELQKVKEMHVAGEKIRRERWVDAKTQKIKELTVKSIEPELQNMTVRHQQEISDLRALHKKELEDLELKAARRTQQQCEALRMQMTEEREKALAHEREIMRQRYEKLVECEEKGYQEQRRRLLQDHANRVAECEEREAAAVADKERLIKQAQDEFEDKLQAVNRRQSNEIKMLREAAELEMEAWKNNFRKKQALEILQKETQIREHCKRERDREIETVIERIDAESSELKNQIEQTTENRIKRMKEKFDNEIRDLELSEKETKKKYSKTRSKLLDSEDVIIGLRASIKQLESQLKEYQEVTNKMNVEKEQMKSIVREELKSEMEALEKEVIQLRNEKDKELQQVYSRVRMAVARKDEVLSELTRDHAALQEKCAYLENMLEQQRKEYLIK